LLLEDAVVALDLAEAAGNSCVALMIPPLVYCMGG
jgi:hypothetical protein